MPKSRKNPKRKTTRCMAPACRKGINEITLKPCCTCGGTGIVKEK